MSALWKIIGVGAAFGIGYLIFRPKKSAASEAGGCFDPPGVQAWAQSEASVKHYLLLSSKNDLALAPTDGTIDTLVHGDTCKVYSFDATARKFLPNDEMTAKLRSFLESLVPVKGDVVSGPVVWE